MTKTAIWLPLGLIAAAAIALTAFISSSAQAGGQAPQATIGVTSAAVAPNGTVTIDFVVTPAAGVSVGAYDVSIVDDALVSATACTHSTFVCNAAPGPADTVLFSAASLSAITGNVGTITYQAGASTGTSNLTVTINSCADTETTPITCAAQNGTITIQEPTATPSPSPSPAPTSPGATAAPTGTGAAGSATPTPNLGGSNQGGNPDDGSTNSMIWVLGALGAAGAAAATWATMRLRRTRA
jgi:hypothetical protein